ncbi:hypothetical protein [Bosea sp. RAC05]|uniref:hypothetical protein n=1 Tax=Bosea sp. RAC05 TaxID=1842539 RepID=UPI000857C1D7|nr:hypothetical protein [Bosea sp. RAC05]AOG03139.1 hypothetical protein BSY19_5064 [Bosea sp. RAC05]
MTIRFLPILLSGLLASTPAWSETLAIVSGIKIEREHVDEFVARQLEQLAKERGGKVDIPARLKAEVESASLGDLVSSVAFGEAARKAGLADKSDIAHSVGEAGKGKLGKIDENLLLAFLWSDRRLATAKATATDADLEAFWGKLTAGPDYRVQVLTFATQKEASAARKEVRNVGDFERLKLRPAGEGKGFAIPSRTDSAFLWRWKHGIAVDGSRMSTFGGPGRMNNGTWGIWIVEAVIDRPRRPYKDLDETSREVVRSEFAQYQEEAFFKSVLKQTPIEWLVPVPKVYADLD